MAVDVAEGLAIAMIEGVAYFPINDLALCAVEVGVALAVKEDKTSTVAEYVTEGVV